MIYLFFGFLMVVAAGLGVLLLLAWNTFHHRPTTYLKKQDRLIQFITVAVFYNSALLITLLTDNKYFLLFFVVCSFVGLILEFSIGWIYYQIEGIRLYRYFKNNLLGFTSWNTLPLWGGAGMFFYALSLILIPEGLKLDAWKILVNYCGYGFISVFIYVVGLGIINFSQNKISKSEGFQWWKYNLFLFFSVGGILGLILIDKLTFLAPYFVISFFLGVILEGMLDKVIKKINGERLWIYTKYPLFDGGTSLLIAPVWFTGALVALVITLVIFG